MDRESRLKLYEEQLRKIEEAKENKRKEVLEKSKERGYNLVMESGDKNWYSFIHEHRPINLQVWVSEEEFELTHMVSQSIVKVTTTRCGSFFNEKHFNGIERQIRRVVVNLI